MIGHLIEKKIQQVVEVRYYYSDPICQRGFNPGAPGTIENAGPYKYHPP